MDEIDAWERIFQDKQLLVGTFVLSTALRTDGGRLVVPGGKAAEEFWSTLVGVDCVDFPLDFLEKLTTLEDGKFNYLYVFSFFLEYQKKIASYEDRWCMIFSFYSPSQKSYYQQTREVIMNNKINVVS